MKLRIRGIYATALTKLALSWGFKIVQPAEKIIQRFGIEADNSPPDATVKDHVSKSGVVVIGKCEAVDKFLEKLKAEVDPFVAKSPVGVREVFVGRAVGEGRVEGPGGLLFKTPPRYVLTPGGVGIYTVLKPPVGPLEGVAAPEIIVEGDYVELNTTGRVTYSSHIPQGERIRLRILAETKLKNYVSMGLRFKSSARYANDEVIIEETERLYRELLELSKGGSPYTILRRGSCFAVVLFDREAKTKLDSVRAQVVPTARGHHALRTQGLEMCLDLIDYAQVDIYEKAVEFLARGRVAILHIKPWGEVVKKRGVVLGIYNDVLVIKRDLKPGGVLDGIGVKIESGFYALTCVPRGENYVVHTYYDGGGREVGTYININTTPEWGRRIVYIDLLLDKVQADGVERLIDTEEFEKYKDFFPTRWRSPQPPVGKMRCTERGLEL